MAAGRVGLAMAAALALVSGPAQGLAQGAPPPAAGAQPKAAGECPHAKGGAGGAQAQAQPGAPAGQPAGAACPHAAAGAQAGSCPCPQAGAAPGQAGSCPCPNCPAGGCPHAGGMGGHMCGKMGQMAKVSVENTANGAVIRFDAKDKSQVAAVQQLANQMGSMMSGQAPGQGKQQPPAKGADKDKKK